MSRAIITALGTAAFLALLVLLTSGHLPVRSALQALATASHGDYVDAGVRIVPPPSAASSGLEGEADGGADGMSKTDFEGDEVSPALATYGIDREGNLFEVHSPHTEVPRLAGPTI